MTDGSLSRYTAVMLMSEAHLQFGLRLWLRNLWQALLLFIDTRDLGLRVFTVLAVALTFVATVVVLRLRLVTGTGIRLGLGGLWVDQRWLVANLKVWPVCMHDTIHLVHFFSI